MTDTSGVPESGIVFFKGGGHSHDGVNSSPINTSYYSIFDFNLSVSTTNADSAREYNRSVNRETFNQYIQSFISSQVLQPAGIILAENTVRGINIGADEITADKIAANTITANELASEIILVNNTIKSNNYVANTSGWAIFSNGFAEFMNADINGAIVANSGTMGGFTISSNTISAGSGTSYIALQSNTASNAYTIWLGNSTAASAPFSVRSNGYLLADSGAIGGWTVNTTAIAAGFTALYSNGTIVAAAPTINSPSISSAGGGSIGGININLGSLSYSTGSFGSTVSVYNSSKGIILDGSTLTSRYKNGGSTYGSVAAAVGSSGGASLTYDSNEHYYPTTNYFVITPVSTTTQVLMSLPTGTGSAVYSSGTQLVKAASKRSLKYDITNYNDAIEKLKLLNPVSFKWRINKNSSNLALFLKDRDVRYGFIVEEIEEVDKGLINYDYVGPKETPDDEKFDDPSNFEPVSYDPNGIISILTAALKDILARVESIEGQLNI